MAFLYNNNLTKKERVMKYKSIFSKKIFFFCSFLLALCVWLLSQSGSQSLRPGKGICCYRLLIDKLLSRPIYYFHYKKCLQSFSTSAKIKLENSALYQKDCSRNVTKTSSFKIIYKIRPKRYFPSSFNPIYKVEIITGRLTYKDGFNARL